MSATSRTLAKQEGVTETDAERALTAAKGDPVEARRLIQAAVSSGAGLRAQVNGSRPVPIRGFDPGIGRPSEPSPEQLCQRYGYSMGDIYRMYDRLRDVEAVEQVLQLSSQSGLDPNSVLESVIRAARSTPVLPTGAGLWSSKPSSPIDDIKSLLANHMVAPGRQAAEPYAHAGSFDPKRPQRYISPKFKVVVPKPLDQTRAQAALAAADKEFGDE